MVVWITWLELYMILAGLIVFGELYMILAGLIVSMRM